MKIKKVYKDLLNTALFLFPEYASARFTRKGEVVFREKGLFGKRKKFKIEDLVCYHIPLQISLNKWQSRDWYDEFVIEWIEENDSIDMQELISFLKNEALKISLLNLQPFICKERKFIPDVGVVESNSLEKKSIIRKVAEDILDNNKIFWQKDLLRYMTVRTATWSLILYLNLKPLVMKVDFLKLLSFNPLITEMKSSLFYNHF